MVLPNFGQFLDLDYSDIGGQFGLDLMVGSDEKDRPVIPPQSFIYYPGYIIVSFFKEPVLH